MCFSSFSRPISRPGLLSVNPPLRAMVIGARHLGNSGVVETWKHRKNCHECQGMGDENFAWLHLGQVTAKEPNEWRWMEEDFPF